MHAGDSLAAGFHVMSAAPLAGLRVVEISAFVAAPLAGMSLAQLGAEVIRIDPLGGNIDIARMPRAPGGDSIYWAALNKGKRSVALPLHTPEGQEAARRIVCAPGADAGIVLTNLQARGWMSFESLASSRADLIMIQLTGNRDGSAALDYTVNCASGFPVATGIDEAPVNHVLPAWDVAAGLYIAMSVLAAERVRRTTGRGQQMKLALSDVMLATVANLGYVGDVQVNGTGRAPIGNHLYGAFGHDFKLSDGRSVMVVAISDRQWQSIGKATGLADRLAMIGPMMGVDMATEDGRFAAREAITALLRPWFAERTLPEVGRLLDAGKVLWGPYQDFGQLVGEDPRCSTSNPMFSIVDQPGIGNLLSPRYPVDFSLSSTPPAQAAPRLGADTFEVLCEVAGLAEADARRLCAIGPGRATTPPKQGARGSPG